MRDDFQLVARIPYPVTVPKSYAVASEAATMDFLRSSGMPILHVYGYSPTSDNVAETEYILMEFVHSAKLSNIWFDLGEREIEGVMRQLVQLMMSVFFSGWWKPVLRARPGEDGWEARHSAQG